MAKFFRVPFAAVGDREEIPDETQGTGAVSYPEGFGFDYERDPATDPAAKRVPRKQTNQYLYDITDNLRQYQLFGSPEWVPASENGGEPVAYAPNARVLFDGKLYRALQATTAQPGVGDTWREEEPFNLAALRASTAQAQAGTDNATLMTPLRVKEAIAAQTTTLTPAQILAALLTVDGPGSGLDADLLDGYHASAFARLTGATFTGNVSLSGTTAALFADGRMVLRAAAGGWTYLAGGSAGIAFRNENSTNNLGHLLPSGFTRGPSSFTVWDAGNDGPGSGLDADMLDGLQGSFYRNASNLNAGTLLFDRLPIKSVPYRAHQLVDGDDLNNLAASDAGFYLHPTQGNSISNLPINRLGALAVLRWTSGLAYQMYATSISGVDLYLRGQDAYSNWRGWEKVWHTGNDGPGSGLDADLLDGLQASAFARLTGATFTGNVSLSGSTALFADGRMVLRSAAGIWTYLAGGSAGIAFRNENDTDTIGRLTPAGFTRGPSSFTVWDAGNDGAGSGLDADLLDGLQGSAYLKTADFSQSLTTGGYCRLPNGVIMQWGRFTALIDATTTVNFPIVFPNLCGGVTVSGTLNWSGSAEDNAPNVKSGTVLPNRFEVWNAENSSVTVYYVALGF